jgi:hypothetical protein
VPCAEVSIASTGQDGHSHVVIVPDLSPRSIEFIRCFAIHDVGFFGVVERYVRDVIFFLELDRQFEPLGWGSPGVNALALANNTSRIPF